MQVIPFTFAGIPGFVTRTLRDTFVQWGTASFQIEAAKPELRKAIEDALATSDQANLRRHVGSMSRNARKSHYARG